MRFSQQSFRMCRLKKCERSCPQHIPIAEQRQQLADRIEEMKAVMARLDRKMHGYEDLMLNTRHI